MRIGTWNLDGQCSADHQAFMTDANCDVWLLTEVPGSLSLAGFSAHQTCQPTSSTKRWAAILSARSMDALPDPHFASAAVDLGGIRIVSSVLPWRSCGAGWPGRTLAERQQIALDTLWPQLTGQLTIWGGDWNQAFEGPEFVGTRAGRHAIRTVLSEAGLALATGPLESASPGHRSIDHVAVPLSWTQIETAAIPASAAGRRLSDHDAYVVEVSRP